MIMQVAGHTSFHPMDLSISCISGHRRLNFQQQHGSSLV